MTTTTKNLQADGADTRTQPPTNPNILSVAVAEARTVAPLLVNSVDTVAALAAARCACERAARGSGGARNTASV